MSDFPSEEAVSEPKRIQVFGVLHVVFGGLGLLNILGGMVWMPIQMWLLERNIASASSDEERMMYELQKNIYETIGSYNWISWAMAAVVSGFILAAGIMLLKRRKSGLKLSNAYAWCSLVVKVVGMLMFFLVMKPAVTAMMEEMFAELGADVQPVVTVINIVLAVAGVLGPVLAMIYPILTLTMLNKDMVRQHLK